MILQYDAKLSNSLSVDQVNNYPPLYVQLSVDGLKFNTYEWIDSQRFDNELDKLIKYMRTIKNKIKCELVVVKKDEIGDSGEYVMKHGKYRINNKVKFEDCDINIVVKKDGVKSGNKITLEDKIKIFHEYWDEKHKLPDANEIYKDFKIGLFYANCVKNKTTLNMIESIMKE